MADMTPTQPQTEPNPTPRVHTLPLPVAYTLSPVLVALTTLALFLLQAQLRQSQPDLPVRPYGIAFLPVIGLLTVLGGRGPGLLTLGLSVMALWVALVPPAFSLSVSHARDWIELALVTGVGLVVVLGLDAMRQNAVLLAVSEQRQANLQAIMDNAPVGVVTCDPQGRLVYANPQAEALWGRALTQADADHIASQTGLTRVLAVGGPSLIEEQIALERGDGGRVWVDTRCTVVCSAQDKLLGAVALLQDVSQRRQAEAELTASEARFRSLVQNASDIITVLDEQGIVRYKSPSEARILGYGPEDTLNRSVFDWLHPDDAARVAAFFTGITATPGLHPPTEFRIRHQDGSWRELESISSNLLADPAVRGIVVNSRDMTDRNQADRERRRLLAEAQARAHREALLNRIHETLRLSTDPEVIQVRALTALGTALQADRCFFTVVDTHKQSAHIADDWYSDTLSSLAGDYDLSELGVDMAALFRAGRTVRAADINADPSFAPASALLSGMGLLSVMSVPLFDRGRLVASLTVGMTGAGRAWTDDEASLVETVAGLTRSALDAARASVREHRIASTLQDALLPVLPRDVSSLDMDVFYQPALEEASIGGDFHDVFPLDKGLMALVVGDLSGKGLAAAAQVATVRNMLRYALYQGAAHGHSLADSVTELNRVLAEHELLAGFVTLFVGICDSGARMLTYVSCGQEPALLRRARTGDIEELAPTGLVLGAVSEARYTQNTVPLGAGDTLALYTDGVSEAGRNRQDFLGIPRLVRLLHDAPASPASAVTAHLMDGVSAHAAGALHDDVCLLVAIVQGHAPA